MTLTKVRRERMGHIELASPVAHIWFLKSLPSRIGLLLDMTLKDLERVLYFENYVVIEPGLTPLKYQPAAGRGRVPQRATRTSSATTAFTAEIGAEALRHDARSASTCNEGARSACASELASDTTSEAKRKKLVKRLKLIDAFIESGARMRRSG